MSTVSASAAESTPSATAAVQAVPGGVIEGILFYIVAGATGVSAIGICFSRNIVRMAVWLFICLGAVATLYLLLAATFLAAIQLIVYAGGTLVLLVFGVMLTSKSPWVRFDTPWLELLGATVVCGTLFVALSILLTDAGWPSVTTAVPGTTVLALGRSLLTTYLVPFEVAGVLLMIVMVGAAHLARQEK